MKIKSRNTLNSKPSNPKSYSPKRSQLDALWILSSGLNPPTAAEYRKFLQQEQRSKIVKYDLSPELAKRVLTEFEKDILAKTHARDTLNEEISKLGEDVRLLRAQVHASNGGGSKSPTGENKTRIIELLKGSGERGSKLMQIHRATGISVSSVNFTLKKNPDTFKQTTRKLWTLCNTQQ